MRVQFPSVWGGFGCLKCNHDHPMVFVHRLAEGTFAIRQSKCATFEAPFMYLLKGDSSAMLIDSGDLEKDSELVSVLRSLVGGLPLILVHTHRMT